MALTKADKEFFLDLFGSLNKRIDAIEGKLNTLEKRMTTLEKKVAELSGRMDRIEARLNKVEIRVIELDLKIDRVAKEIKSSINALYIYTETGFKSLDGRIKNIEQRFMS